MFYNDEGRICFYYRSTPNWQRIPFRVYEYYVIWDENEEKFFFRKKVTIHKEHDFRDQIFERTENKEEKLVINQKLSNIEFRKIIEIIQNNKELINVDSMIYNRVCDGSHEDFHFDCELFNRTTEGDCVIGIGSHLEEHDELDLNERDYKGLKQSNIVYKTVKGIFDYLKSLGVKFSEEDETEEI